ncbi:MAG: PspC domain-containing protein [Chloroflexia bacterium]|nr:PspC domain-containing protein [Chloroflexia bacterium]
MLDISFYRSATNKWIFGVCGGIAEKLNVNPMWVRLGVLLIAILPAGLSIPPMVLIYVALAVLLPNQGDAPLDFD